MDNHLKESLVFVYIGSNVNNRPKTEKIHSLLIFLNSTGWVANSVGPDQTLRFVSYDLDLPLIARVLPNIL